VGGTPVSRADPGALASAQIERPRPSVTEVWRAPTGTDSVVNDRKADDGPPGRELAGDRAEATLRRRARRQALLLLIASAGVSLVLLYGVWTVLHGFL
jgi:hypothetical protein